MTEKVNLIEPNFWDVIFTDIGHGIWTAVYVMTSFLCEHLNDMFN